MELDTHVIKQAPISLKIKKTKTKKNGERTSLKTK
jgi:hypothetical protein